MIFPTVVPSITGFAEPPYEDGLKPEDFFSILL